MAANVFLLGAGASADCGGPLMSNFLERARQVGRDAITPRREAFALVTAALGSLRSVQAKARIDRNNIESVFAAFEMAQLLKLPLQEAGTDAAEQQDLGLAMRQVIAATLEGTILFPLSSEGWPSAHPIQAKFASVLSQIHETESVAVITFNYDVALDFALHMAHVKTDYCLENPRRAARERDLPLLKLHGSLNWGQCPACARVRDVSFERAFAYLRQRRATNMALPISTRLSQVKCCNKPLTNAPYLVPPTWNKLLHADVLAPVWRRAARELSEAERVFVIGYSLPPTDHFFQYLFALGVDSAASIDEFVLYDIAAGPHAEQLRRRYAAILGPDIEGKLLLESRTFSSAVDLLSERFNARTP